MGKKQWEVDAKDRFLQFLQNNYGFEYSATNEDVTVNPSTGRNYDYELSAKDPALPAIALEVFRLTGNGQDIGQHIAWSEIADRLREALTARGVTGYLIRAPRFFVPKFKRNDFAENTAQRLAAVIASHPNEAELTLDAFAIFKLTGETRISISYIGGIRAVNPFGSATEALDELLPTKNEQLDVQGRLRVLLIVNADMFGHEDAVRDYFSTRDAEQFSNIDRVFFEAAPGKTALVFDRRVFDCYRDHKIPDDEGMVTLFISFVEHRLASDHRTAFEITKMVHAKYGSLERLSVGGKDALISCGDLFVEEADWASVLWIVHSLKDDTDPSFPNPMHEEVAGGKDHLTINSIRGRLSWLIQKVVVHNLVEYYPSMLDILERYATGPDFYIRTQACVPLSEMARRRRATLPDGNSFLPEIVCERLKSLAFRMLNDAGTNPTLLDWVSTILVWIRDLSENEADDVLRKLSPVSGLYGIHNRCALLLYFALFRDKHFPELPRFNSAEFRDRLHQELRKSDSKFRVSLMWIMSGGGDGQALPYEAIQPYLASFLSGPWDEAGFLHLRTICETHVKDKPESVCPLISECLGRIAGHVGTEPRSTAWLIYEFDEFLALLTNNCCEGRVLDAIELFLGRSPRIPAPFRARLATALAQYGSPRSIGLRSRYLEE